MSLGTLWIATWLRDVAGYDPVQVGRGLLVVNATLIAGYLAFGRLAELRARRGASVLPLIACGVGTASLCLALLALGVTTGALALWAAFTFSSSAATLAYALLLRHFPTEMAGRLNTTVNSFVFLAMFLGQWLVGLVLELWPRSGAGYPPQAYHWALGALWLLQLAGLAWFWRGRACLRTGELPEVDVAVRRIDRRADHRSEHQPAEAQGNRRENGQAEQDQAVDEERHDVLQAAEEARLERVERAQPVEHHQRWREPHRHNHRHHQSEGDAPSEQDRE